MSEHTEYRRPSGSELLEVKWFLKGSLDNKLWVLLNWTLRNPLGFQH